MSPLAELTTTGSVVGGHAPWPRIVVDSEQWKSLGRRLGDGALVLSGLWGEQDCVHMAVFEETRAELAVFTLPCSGGRFPSIGQYHAPAIRPERAVRDLFGLIPEDAPDLRPWLDHGRWDTGGNDQEQLHYSFLPAEGKSLHQIAVGPVHAGIIEPGHFRFTVNGEAIVRLEERLGYTHKGIEALMRGADLAHAAKLAGRVSGDSTVAYAIAFARAAEAALAVEIPSRAHWLRGLMAELERLANHLGDIGAICNDAAFALMHAHCGILRERVLRAADDAFGHRLMRDCVIPGGVSCRELDMQDVVQVQALIAEIGKRFPRLVELYDDTTSLQDRTVGAGILKPELARQFGAGGFVGRASGRRFDTRRSLPYPPYDRLTLDVPALDEGDVNARVWIRLREVQQSLALLTQMLEQLPGGLLRAELPRRAGEGIALVEGFRGDVLVWLKLNSDGCVTRCHLRDPSWFQWPLLEAAIGGNIVGDFPLCNKSFNCSYSGHDL